LNWENIKEQLLERWNGIWEQIRDSDTYIQLREKYQNASPTMQKIILGFAITFGALLILLIPFTFLSSSSESIETFESNVRLVRDYYRVQRELSSTPMVPDTPPSSQISSQVQSILGNLGLSPEQMSGTREIAPERDSNNSLQPKGINEHGIEVTLLKLNLKQVVDIGAKLSQLGRGLHLTALDMKVNSQNDHYYDVIFRVTGFSVGFAEPSGMPEEEARTPPPPSNPGRALPPPPANKISPKKTL